jgi:hypothetical protein
VDVPEPANECAIRDTDKSVIDEPIQARMNRCTIRGAIAGPLFAYWLLSARGESATSYRLLFWIALG